MALEIQTSLDAIKRQSLYVILQNVINNFPSIRESLSSYMLTGETSFSTLLSRFPTDDDTLSSSTVSATMFLAYLDFYSLYTICYSNYGVFQSLGNIASSKYAYAYGLYCNTEALLKEKILLQAYSKVDLHNSMFTRVMDNTSSKTVTRGGMITEVANASPIITLPLETTTNIKPASITVNTFDNAEHIITSSIGVDSASVHIDRKTLNKSSASLDVSINFNELDNITYISFDDVSPFPLTTEDELATLRRSRFNSSSERCLLHNDIISKYIFTNGQVATAKVQLTQGNSDFRTQDGSLFQAVDFDLINIKAVSSTFKPSGTFTSSAFNVDQVNTVIFNSIDYIPLKDHSYVSPDPQLSFIEYNVLVRTLSGDVVIPAHPANANRLIFEYVLPAQVSQKGLSPTSGVANYKLRFTPDTSYKLSSNNEYFIVYDIETKESVPATYDIANNTLVLNEYDWKKAYVVWYYIKTYSATNTCDNSKNASGWHSGGHGIYYMYFLDENGAINIAIRSSIATQNTLLPFSGTLATNIELRSIDKSYITPAVFEYSIASI